MKEHIKEFVNKELLMINELVRIAKENNEYVDVINDNGVDHNLL